MSSHLYIPVLRTAASGDLAGTCSLAFTAQATADQPPQPFTVYPGRVVSLSMGGVYRPDVYRFIRHTLFSPNGAPSGDIAGTTSLTFSPAGTLSAAGALAAAQSVTFTVAGSLAGSGALAGTSAVAFTTTAGLSGGSGVSGVSALTFTTTATLAGSGSLAGTSSLAFGTTASLDGAQAGLVGNLPMLVGKAYRQRLESLLWQPYDLVRVFPLTVAESLAGQVSIAFSTTATLTGSGALAGTSALAFGASGTLDAPAAAAYTVFPGKVNAYAFGGVYRPDVYRFVRATLWQPAVSTPGVLEGTSALAFAASGAVTGAGAVAGTAALTFAPTATMAGAGALAGTSALTFTLAATATGAGALTGASAVVFSASGTLVNAASNDLAGTVPLIISASAALTGDGALTGVSSVAFDAVGVLVDSAPGGLSGTVLLAFTATGSIIPPNDGASVGAGRASKRRKRYYVEIDGQTFEANTLEKARALLEQARAIAEQAAEKAAQQAERRVTRRVRRGKEIGAQPLRVEPPTITLPVEYQTELEPLRREIERLYANAAAIAEMRLRLKIEADRLDDDDEAILLLM